mmetsp:Transcript_564/g.1150  ORF Transcript_564/g.1150 Transcript_564/m.1150 type:complete len:398 (+) Transcript_564:252-1445(+)
MSSVSPGPSRININNPEMQDSSALLGFSRIQPLLQAGSSNDAGVYNELVQTGQEQHGVQTSGLTSMSFVAGCISGTIGTAVGFPLDSLKVRLQAQGAPPLTSILSLFRGIGIPVATAGVIQSLNLGLYENFRRSLHQGAAVSVTEPTPLHLIGAAGSLAGVCIAPVTCPTQRIKIVQQLQGGQLLPTTLSLWREGTLFRGFGINLLFEATRGVYMITYVSMKRELARFLDDTPPRHSADDCVSQTRREAQLHTEASAVSACGDCIDPRDCTGNGDNCGASGVLEARTVAASIDERPLPLWARVVAGAAANMVAWAIIYPLDVVKTVQQSAMPKGAGGRRDQSFLHCARELWLQGGIARFYKGVGYTLVRAGPVAGILLPLFDVSLAALERVAQVTPS